MYLSPVDIINDFMITKHDGINVTSIKLYTINGIFTSNEYFCSEVEKWTKDNIIAAKTFERFEFIAFYYFAIFPIFY